MERPIDRASKVALAQRKEAYFHELGELTELWQNEYQRAQSHLYREDGTIDQEVLENFRRYSILLHDLGPETAYANWNPRYWYKDFLKNPLRGAKQFLRQHLNGQFRGNKAMMIRSFEILKRVGGLEILKRHDVSQTPGNSYCYRYQDCTINGRWPRYAYSMLLLHKHLKTTIEQDRKFVNLDLGCNYGAFSYFFFSEFPKTTHILVDLPDQIAIAHYFLSQRFQNARIASYLDFKNLPSLNRNYVENFDFVLVPITQFQKLEPGVADMMTNFDSLGEMTRQWFSFYLESAVFKKCRYFMTTNPFISSPWHDPTHGNDLSLWDYPWDDFETILFDVNPMLNQYTTIQNKYWYTIESLSSSFFDFIGKRKAV